MSALLDAWWKSGPGFAPLLCEPLVRACAAHLEVLPSGSRFVDIGCGDAHMVRALASMSYRAIGVDAEIGMLAPHAHGSTVLSASGEQLPVKSESIDAVFAFSAFQYMRREIVLAECHRILRSGGRFAIVENLAGNPFAKLERARRWLFHVASPRGHLSWGGRRVYEQFFSEVTYEAHHIVAPTFLGSKTIRSTAGPKRSLAAACLRGVQRVEQALLQWPGVPALAWHAVIYGRK